MGNKKTGFVVARLAFILSISAASSASMAATTLSAAIGGTPIGEGPYINFDSLAPTGGATDGGITVSFSGIGAGTIDVPNVVGKYAAPYISGAQWHVVWKHSGRWSERYAIPEHRYRTGHTATGSVPQLFWPFVGLSRRLQHVVLL